MGDHNVHAPAPPAGPPDQAPHPAPHLLLRVHVGPLPVADRPAQAGEHQPLLLVDLAVDVGAAPGTLPVVVHALEVGQADRRPDTDRRERIANPRQVGIVIAQNRNRRLRPKLLLVRDPDGEAYRTPKIIDLSLFSPGETIDVVEIVRPADCDIDVAQYVENTTWAPVKTRKAD